MNRHIIINIKPEDSHAEQCSYLMNDKELKHDAHSNNSKPLLLAEHRKQTEQQAPAQMSYTCRI